jgi:hypothetical protein
VKLTSREKAVIWVGSGIVAAVLIFYGATKLLPTDSGDLSQTVELKKRVLRNRRETRLELYGRRLDQDMIRLLPGDNPNVAGAELQKILKDFADQSGVEITQKNTLPEKKVQDMLTKVSVVIQTNCDLDQLVQFMTAIENYQKLLKIEEFIITSFRNPAQKRYDIRPSLTVVGYIGSRESKPAEKPANRM